MVRVVVNRRAGAALTGLAVAAAVALALCQADKLSAQAGNNDKTSAAKVKATATATAADASGKQVVTVTLNIDKGWYVYANPAENETVAAAKTIVRVRGQPQPQSVRVDYPPGKLHADKDFRKPDGSPDTYRVYEDRVTIRAHVQRVQGSTGPLEVIVRVNACNVNSCLKQASIRLTVP